MLRAVFKIFVDDNFKKVIYAAFLFFGFGSQLRDDCFGQTQINLNFVCHSITSVVIYTTFV